MSLDELIEAGSAETYQPKPPEPNPDYCSVEYLRITGHPLYKEIMFWITVLFGCINFAMLAVVIYYSCI